MLRYMRQHSWFAWLGLLALACQFGLTLGHMHAARESGSSDAHVTQLARHFEARGHIAALAELARHHRETQPDPNDLGGSCAYCWTIAQAASLILPSPVRIKHDRSKLAFALSRPTTQLLPDDQTSPFESRGPPLTSKA